MRQADDETLLRLTGVSKRFLTTIANDEVDLEIKAGEIHALLGENGAGKSTLVKIIYGILQPDAGQIFYKGEKITISSPNDARRAGIGMVFQHFSLFEAMTVAENIAVGLPKSLAGDDLSDRIRDISQSYGLPLDPERGVWMLSVGERQRIEIVRCLLQSPKLLIMDEPTSVLTPQEADKLFETLNRLASEGVAILYISHRLEEIRKLCHKATIMRLGKVVSDCDPAQETARSLAEMMMGAELKAARRGDSHDQDINDKHQKQVLLAVEGLNAPSPEAHSTALQNVNFNICAGEIFAIAGLAGNGQNELMDLLVGERALGANNANQIRFKDQPIGTLSPNRRRDLGMGFVPEERLGHGAVPEMSLWLNTLLSAASSQNLTQNGFIQTQATLAFADKIIKGFSVKTPNADAHAASLSGGNLQKFIMGREILQAPQLLIILQPTWGVDAGAAAFIHQQMINLAATGTAILVISQDLDEIFVLADKIAVICEGKLSPAQPASDMSVEQVGLLMGGSVETPIAATQ